MKGLAVESKFFPLSIVQPSKHVPASDHCLIKQSGARYCGKCRKIRPSVQRDSLKMPPGFEQIACLVPSCVERRNDDYRRQSSSHKYGTNRSQIWAPLNEEERSQYPQLRKESQPVRQQKKVQRNVGDNQKNSLLRSGALQQQNYWQH